MPWPPSSEQIGAVKRYLEAAFPSLQVDVKHDDADMILRFRLVQKSEIKHELIVGRVIFDDHSPYEIASILSLHGISQRMRPEGSTVRITKYQRTLLIS